MGGQVVTAEPAAITEAKSEAEALRARIDELADQFDAVVEDYNYARAQLADTQAAAEENQARLAMAQEDLGVLQEQLTDRVVEIYKQGHLGAIAALAESESFSDFVNRLDLLERLSEQDSQMLADVVSYRDEVEQRKGELAQQLEDEKVLTAQTEAAKAQVEKTLAANAKALAGKEAQIAQLVEEERIRQERLAAEAAERARKEAEAKAAAEKAAAEKAAAEKARIAAAEKASSQSSSSSSSSSGSSSSSSSGSSSSSSSSSGGSSSSSGGSVPSSAIGGDVVSIAMQYLGVPYVWAGSSPSGGFDCSGFVMYVFAKVGVSLPHSSRMQSGYGTAVSRSQLQKGDLVFFYSPIHHVGIYIGGGQMIHAAGTGKDVRISSVWTSSYNCARRIL